MLEKIDRVLLSRSFKRFIVEAWPQLESEHYIHGRHIDVMAAHLEAAAHKKIDRLLINIPPSCSKSSVMMVMFPAWVWTWDKKAGFLCQTYSQDLTLRDATNCRRLVESDWYKARWPDVRFHADDNAKKYYRVVGGGWRLSTVVGGRVTGEHPNFILCDDSVSVDDAENRKTCKDWEDWYHGTLSTRGIGKGAVHVIGQQRVSIYDPSSVAIGENIGAEKRGEPKPWHHICLPMRMDPEILMQDRGYGGDWRRQPGELLFPQFLSEAKVAKVERSLGPRKSVAQLGQKPQAIEGQAIDTTKIHLISAAQVPKCEVWVRFWDKAATAGKGCRTAGVLMGIRRATRDTFNYIFTHVRKGQWGTDQVEAEIHKHAIADAMRLGNETYFVGVEREPGSGGVFSVDATKRRLREFKVRAIRATKDKLVTAEPLAVAVGFGEVYCVDDPEWTADFIQELTDAPGGQFMDQFDAAAKAVVLANDEIGKQKRRAILSGDQVVDLCLSGCGRPVAENSDYCCSSCEQVAAFGDPDMQADHDANCIQRYFNYQNRG